MFRAPAQIEDVERLDQLGSSLRDLCSSSAQLIERTHEQRVPGRRSGSQVTQFGVCQISGVLVGGVLEDLGNSLRGSRVPVILGTPMTAVPVAPVPNEPGRRVVRAVPWGFHDTGML